MHSTISHSRFSISSLVIMAVLATSGCLNVNTHSTIEPIYMTLDVNLKVQLQQELEDAFDDIDATSRAIEEE